MINIEFVTIHKDSIFAIPLSVTEIISDSQRIGIVNGDFDGISRWNICSDKIVNNKLTFRVYAINCKPFEKEYLIKSDSKLTINLEYGESEFRTRKERNAFINKKFGIPFCGTNDMIDEELENADYRHCDGKIKKHNEIPSDKIHEWEK